MLSEVLAASKLLPTVTTDVLPEVVVKMSFHMRREMVPLRFGRIAAIAPVAAQIKVVPRRLSTCETLVCWVVDGWVGALLTPDVVLGDMVMERVC